jgi:hypothetical protein
MDLNKRYSLHLFSNRYYERAFALFNEINIHPREVIALFPPSISGIATNEQSREKSTDIDETTSTTLELFNGNTRVLILY